MPRPIVWEEDERRPARSPHRSSAEPPNSGAAEPLFGSSRTVRGTVVSVRDGSGFGFVKPDPSSTMTRSDVFFHLGSSLAEGTFPDELRPGTAVEFSIVYSKDEKPRATGLRKASLIDPSTSDHLRPAGPILAPLGLGHALPSLRPAEHISAPPPGGPAPSAGLYPGGRGGLGAVGGGPSRTEGSWAGGSASTAAGGSCGLREIQRQQQSMRDLGGRASGRSGRTGARSGNGSGVSPATTPSINSGITGGGTAAAQDSSGGTGAASHAGASASAAAVEHDKRKPLLLLLRAPDEAMIEKLFSDCFEHRRERGLPREKAATLVKDLKLEKAEQAKELFDAVRSLVWHLTESPKPPPIASLSDEASRLFSDAFHEELRELLVRLLVQRVPGWRAKLEGRVENKAKDAAPLRRSSSAVGEGGPAAPAGGKKKKKDGAAKQRPLDDGATGAATLVDLANGAKPSATKACCVRSAIAARDSGDDAFSGSDLFLGGASSVSFALGPSSGHESMSQWLEERFADVERDLATGTTLLQGAKLPQVLIDVLDSEGLPNAVIRQLFALLSHRAICDSILRERVDGLYRRLLESPMFDPVSSGAARRAAAAAAESGSADALHAERASHLTSYIDQLPTTCAELSGGGGGQPTDASPRPHLAPVTDVVEVLTQLASRVASDPSALARLEHLAAPLHRLSSHLSLPQDAIEAIDALLTLLDSSRLQQLPPPDGGLATPSHVAILATGRASPARTDSLPSSEPTPNLLPVAARQASVSSGAAALPAAWVTLPPFPTMEELHSPAPPPSARHDGVFTSAEDYLFDIFSRLREDVISPLRSAIRELSAGSADGASPAAVIKSRSYHSVRLLSLQCGAKGVTYRLAFLPHTLRVDWSRSTRLLPGSLLGLSADGFSSCTWAVVAARDVAMLCDPSGPTIDVTLPEMMHHRFLVAQARGMNFQMIECPVFSRATRQLQQLVQRFEPDALPFSQSLLATAASVPPPSHLVSSTDAEVWDLSHAIPEFPRPSSEAVRMLSQWPKPADLDDAERCEAIRHALTKEVAVIDAAPGAGGTDVLLAAARALLVNGPDARARAPIPCSGAIAERATASRPLLLVCPTDRTLDVVLEQLVALEPRLIRIGSRPAQKERLRACSLRQQLMADQNNDDAHGRAWRALSKQQKELREQIEALAAGLVQGELTADDLNEVAGTTQIMSLCSDGPGGWLDTEDALHQWLSPVRAAVATGQTSASKVAEHRPAQSMSSGEAAEPTAASHRVKGTLADHEDELELWEANAVLGRNGSTYLAPQFDRMLDDLSRQDEEGAFVPLGRECSRLWPDAATAERLREEDELWGLSTAERAHLCTLWLAKQHEPTYVELSRLAEEYERLCKDKQNLERSQIAAAVRHAPLLGISATALGILAPVIATLRPSVVLVHQAADVPEATLLAALGPETGQLILVGDRCGAARAADDAGTGWSGARASMFERLLFAGLEYAPLQRQRRMVPSIARLLAPLYPSLRCHGRARGRKPVRGVSLPVFFLSHARPEDIEPTTNSRCSVHEAGFVVALAHYFTCHKYEPSAIAILTPYVGQQELICREIRSLRDGGAAAMADVRVATIDGFEGEEVELLILSMVRSNDVGALGCAGNDRVLHRAISCARDGLYVIGNVRTLRSGSKLWTRVLALVEEQPSDDAEVAGGRIGEWLPLLATRAETGRPALVRTAADFKGLTF